MINLNLGCGSQKMDGFVNLDISPDVGADVVHDLDLAPWPFPSAIAQTIVAQDVFEHVDDALLFMRECHRILISGGELWIKTPHWSHRDAFTDPTHKRFPTEFTFDYWVRGTALWQLHNKAYGGFDFERKTFPRVQNGAMFVHLVRP